MSQVSPIPDGYHNVTPYIIVKGAEAAMEFYEKVFGASILGKLEMPGGLIGHAEIQIGDSRVMLSDEHPQMGANGPGHFGGSPVTLHLYVENVDEIFAKAVEAGVEIIRPVADQFYGDRSGMFKDPFGHTWNVSTHVEDVSPEQMQERMAKMHGDC